MTTSEQEFEELVQVAYDDLPDTYREACKDLVIRTEALPSSETMAALDLLDPYELLGLYHGINLARKSILDLPTMLDIVVVYRLPILAYSRTNGITLQSVVSNVLVHEIGHHFGLSDDDMAAIEES